MFCPNCGKANQSPDAYCRNCGAFLTDFTGHASLINRFFGANTPDKRVNIGLALDALTLVFSALLLVFLFGYFDARFTRTGEVTPPIVYFVYLFLGFIALWQSLSLFVGISHKNKLRGRRKEAPTANQAVSTSKRFLSEVPKDYLPPADTENVVPPSVVEDTTKLLDKTQRK